MRLAPENLKTREWREWETRPNGRIAWKQPGGRRSHHRRLFWMKGVPGAGKSIYIKFVIRKARKSQKFKSDIILAHFFHARAQNELAKSTKGMYRTILTQFLQNMPAEYFQQLEARHRTSAGRRWGLETLPNLFSDVLRDCSRPVTCFIDALDECDEDQIRAMVKSFQDLPEDDSLQFRACFASIYYPNMTAPDGVAIDFRLDQQPCHFNDIRTYISRHLNVSSSLVADTTREEVLAKAKGVFIWCKLVIEILNQECDRGCLNQTEVVRPKSQHHTRGSPRDLYPSLDAAGAREE